MTTSSPLINDRITPLRSFTDMDWEEFLGAQCFESGDEPLIGEVTGFTCVRPCVYEFLIDCSGTTIYLTDDDGDIRWTASFPAESSRIPYREVTVTMHAIARMNTSDEVVRFLRAIGYAISAN